jgi:hypothetical protein
MKKTMMVVAANNLNDILNVCFITDNKLSQNLIFNSSEEK